MYSQNKFFQGTILCLTLTLLFCLPSQVFAEEEVEEETEDFMEISFEELLNLNLTKMTVLGVSHVHPKGEWMGTYRYMMMGMEGNRDGTTRLSESEVLSRKYMVSPLEMTMEMHMFSLMYGFTDNLNGMVMVPYVIKSMDLLTGMDVKFTSKSDGLGDISLVGLYKIVQRNEHQVLINAGITLPSGSINKRGDTPMATNVKLPYPMQLGSGTVDPLITLTYLGITDHWSWGTSLKSTFRLYKNSNGYSLGDQFNLTTWLSGSTNDWVTVTGRLDVDTMGNIDGSDPDLNPMMVPTADPNLRGYTKVYVGIGGRVHPPVGMLQGHQLSVEYRHPIYQYLDGPQLETDRILSFAWTVIWG